MSSFFKKIAKEFDDLRLGDKDEKKEEKKDDHESHDYSSHERGHGGEGYGGMSFYITYFSYLKLHVLLGPSWLT